MLSTEILGIGIALESFPMCIVLECLLREKASMVLKLMGTGRVVSRLKISNFERAWNTKRGDSPRMLFEAESVKTAVPKMDSCVSVAERK